MKARSGSTSRRPFPPLEPDITADVCVIGAGIVGVTTALAPAGGRRARRADRAETARPRRRRATRPARCPPSTARSTRPCAPSTAREAHAHTARPTRPRSTGSRHVNATSTATSAAAPPTSTHDSLDRSTEEARGGGRGRACPRRSSTSAPLPFDIESAVRFDDQAEFHPHKYLLGLAESLPEVYEHTHAVQVGDAVRTPGGRSPPSHTIVATHMPFPDRSLAFARVHPQRSYAITCRITACAAGRRCSSARTRPPARSAPSREELLLVGGDGHRPGTGAPQTATRASRRSPASTGTCSSVDHRWSLAGPDPRRRTCRSVGRSRRGNRRS